MNSEQQWQRVLSRSEGDFFYGVKTTGVFCRPTCPSRRPRRESVEFFDAADAAKRAGYRACLRCKPEEADARVAAIAAACRFLDANPDAKLGDVAEHVALSPFHLQRTFKKVMGVSPAEYARGRRAAALKSAMARGASVTDAMYEAGYGSPSRLYESQPLGMTPTTWRRGGAGLTIRFTIAETPVGTLLLARTERGVCAIEFGDGAERALRAEFPAATIVRDDEALAADVAHVAQHLAGAERSLELPLDVQATAFQRRVWQALRAIPYGETRTYAEVAAELGAPRGARAVARACATNRVALAVPCHRVVRGDGELAGYKWGIERKRALLARERAAKG